MSSKFQVGNVSHSAFTFLVMLAVILNLSVPFSHKLDISAAMAQTHVEICTGTGIELVSVPAQEPAGTRDYRMNDGTCPDCSMCQSGALKAWDFTATATGDFSFPPVPVRLGKRTVSASASSDWLWALPHNRAPPAAA